MWKNILVAFDGSDHAMWALDRAIEIGKKDQSKITVFYALKHNFKRVTPTIFPFFSQDEDPFSLDPATEARVYQSQKNMAARILKEAGKKLEESGLEYDLELIENVGPVDAAMELVKLREIDLLIVGARGVHGPIERLVLGSVTSGIVNKVCEANILIIRTACSA
ncbi:hypothetical protein GF325_16235 [Candidatus Bathyarchaeota archaeon]|nr:hypothetical protein [Candidatus Bathyarchaeota archaeon]